MTSILFEKWLRNLGKQMRYDKHKIAMIINNCLAQWLLTGGVGTSVHFQGACLHALQHGKFDHEIYQ